MSLIMVISGGQTGADRAGLIAAQASGLPTAGTVPRGWRTENGTDLSLRAFNVHEHPSSEYPPRTKRNVHDADGTLILTLGPLDGGSQLTAGLCRQARKPHLWLDLRQPQSLIESEEWIVKHGIRVLNVAGNRESKAPGITIIATSFLKELFKRTSNPSNQEDLPCPSFQPQE